jgi:hypothetical protein
VINIYLGDDFYFDRNNPRILQEDDDDDDTPTFSAPLIEMGIDKARMDYCATGMGVKVAILDSGVDYTHEILGGEGTEEAFEAAYGMSYFSDENKDRDGLFPTDTVVDGFDFVGDMLRMNDLSYYAQPDDDPIDMDGHGTAVAHAVLAVAPDVEIVAVKVCLTQDNACPDFALVRGIEYVLDPNRDGSTDDKVDIVNLSLGRPYTSSYYSVIAKALEDVFAAGVLPIVAAGNHGNVPYVMGGASSSPNAISVGATLAVGSDVTMAPYSSRGPGEDNLAKPDIVAPGGPFLLAEAGSGNGTKTFQGTSFASPLIAGGAALLKQHCPSCSPFALKCLLMNHADSVVGYRLLGEDRAPVTLAGSGQIQVQRSIDAVFWAYSVDDVQPAMSLGLINAASDLVIIRRIRIVKLSPADQTETLGMGYEFRSAGGSNAVSISFSSEVVSLQGDCGSEAFVDVTFQIDASKAPANHMTYGGSRGTDPNLLDWNEVDGWLTITSTDRMYATDDKTPQEADIPFHMVLRKASNATVANPIIASDFDFDTLPANVPINLSNKGAETAQIDAFDLLFISEDDAEIIPRGGNDPPSDLKYIGVRTVPSNQNDCKGLLEFAIHTWEAKRTLAYTHFFIFFDLNLDNDPDYVLYNAGVRYGVPHAECRLKDLETDEEFCTGFPPDHTTNSANTVLRMCINDLGLDDEDQMVSVAVSTLTFPEGSHSDETEFKQISLSHPALSAPSYDVEPGQILRELSLSGTGKQANGADPLGILLFTNAFRTLSKTGSSTRDSEALVITRDDIRVPQEQTADDVFLFPRSQDFEGPACSWNEIRSQCEVTSLRRSLTVTTTPYTDLVVEFYRLNTVSNGSVARHQLELVTSEVACAEMSIPRASVGSLPPVAPTEAPTDAPTLHIVAAPPAEIPVVKRSTEPPSELLETLPGISGPNPTGGDDESSALSLKLSSMLITSLLLFLLTR